MQLTVNELEQAEASKHQQSHYELQSLFSNMGPYLYLETGIEPMLRIIEEICYESEMELKGADLQIQSLFVQLLVHMMRILSPSLPLCSTLPPPANTIDKDQGDIIDGFFDRYQEPLTINDLSELLYISDKQTNRILNKYYQTSFKQKQLDTRVQVALDLLLSTQMTISEIAEHVGYAPAYNFSKVFKQKMGITPKQYRKQITLHRT
jgi:AraC-like DNA-binding protein